MVLSVMSNLCSLLMVLAGKDSASQNDIVSTFVATFWLVFLVVSQPV